MLVFLFGWFSNVGATGEGGPQKTADDHIAPLDHRAIRQPSCPPKRVVPVKIDAANRLQMPVHRGKPV